MRILVLAAILALAAGCGRQTAKPTTVETGSWHVVQAGQLLADVAAEWQVSTRSIIEANRLASGSIFPGQRLRIVGGTHQPRPEKPAATPVANWYVPRSTWATAPIQVRLADKMNGTPTRITVHHAGDEKSVTRGGVTWLRTFDQRHMQKGWACIGYHFIISEDGTVYEGRPLEWQGAHAGSGGGLPQHLNPNYRNIGICLVGDFTTHAPTAQQTRQLFTVLERLRHDHGIRRDQVFGHNQVRREPTDCPGVFLSPWLAQYVSGRLPEQRAPAR